MVHAAFDIQTVAQNNFLSESSSDRQDVLSSTISSPASWENRPAQISSSNSTPSPFHTPPDLSLISDAAIFGICQSAPGIFWGVGDRGAVWTSTDNGEKWYLVKVPTAANLCAVSFSDRLNGLIVGGSILPGTPNGSGVILRTTDGGQNWNLVDTAGIPYLHDLHFGEDGIAEIWGDSSELYPSGYFISEDGGQNWDSPIKAARHCGWKRGNRARFFMGLNKEGLPVRFDQDRILPIEALSGLPPFTDLTGTDDVIFLVGRSGTLFRWQQGENPVQIRLPDEAKEFEFETVSFSNNTIHIAGNPGTKIFSSHDAGQTWHASETGMAVPIRKLLAGDGNTLLGVGDLGNIIVSRDGGLSWQTKHEGGRRAAWLGLFENGETLPYQWVASLSLKEGWLGVADILMPPLSSSASLNEISPLFRSREAFIAAGGSSLLEESAFPAPPTELKLPLENITDHWTTRHGETPETALRRRLVRMIRIWKPDLILLSEKSEPQSFLTPAIRSLAYDSSRRKSPIRTVAGYENKRIDPVKLALLVDQHWDHSKDPVPTQNGLAPLSQMIRTAVLDAVSDAADPRQFPEQIQQLGLSPWQVKRIGVASENALSMNVKMGDYLSCTGESVEEAAFRANRIAGQDSNAAVWRGMELIPTPGNDGFELPSNLPSPLGDIEVGRGSESRRPPTANPPDKESALNRIQQRRRLMALVDRLTADGTNMSDIFRSNLHESLHQVDRETAAEALLRAGKNLIQRGDPDSASEYLEQLIASYPETSAGRPGAAELLRYYAGIERIRRKEVIHTAQNRFGPISGDSAEETDSEVAHPIPAIVDHASDAVRIGNFIRDYYPELYMTEDVRFPLAAAQRRAGQIQNAVGYYFNRSNLQTDGDAVALHALGEYALLEGSNGKDKDSLPLPVGQCRSTVPIPYLDGELEPEIWNQAESFRLSSNEGVFPETNVYLLSGKEFLFIGIVAKDDKASTENTSLAPRMRDGNMADFDRIEMALDPDRDFSGFYHFVFDSRGWISESCRGDSQWNPQIYAANKKKHFGWVFEAAIPWKEFCDTSPSAGNVWGIAIRRILPMRGFSSWYGVGSSRFEDGFGYLRF